MHLQVHLRQCSERWHSQCKLEALPATAATCAVLRQRIKHQDTARGIDFMNMLDCVLENAISNSVVAADV